MSLISPRIEGDSSAVLPQNSLLFFGIFLVAGMVLGKLMRMAVDETIGPDPGIGDRLAGAVLGVVRIGLVAIMLVLVFDRAPAARSPAGVPERFAAAAAAVGGRAKRFWVAAARCRGDDRSVEEGPSDMRLL